MKPELVRMISVTLLVITAGIVAGAQDTDDGLARLAALESRLATLEQEIGLLEDSKAIKRLQRIYGYYVDKGLSTEVAALFADHATVELGVYGVYAGQERIAALYTLLLGDGPVDGQLDNHIIMQGVVHVAPDGASAKGRWRALMQLGVHGASATWSEGPYENEYIKEDGMWKFSKVHWYATFTAPYDPGWHKEQIPMPGPLEDLPPDMPPTEVYQSYPGVHVPPFHYVNPVSGRRYGAAP